MHAIIGIANRVAGIWFGLECKLPPIVWCVKFLKESQDQVVSHKNPKKGTISILDLEMVGCILDWLVL